ncbi:Glycosyltransferase involved in cell wall bisynthesis [Pseudobutyrivibrio sp. 49]|uniref:glycosyltransferase n=1 Tax=Pseudobutyrivibrio sp. 49 TaxID=1855344 RepID=UPI00088DB924|nr:glycosyltransferase [Pseudobutyrivibrio sp. 49]SDI03143.1 Glycosyltransferase involved in cell wall bisynthesis [Pseudobutyrivibrio sp. 49]
MEKKHAYLVMAHSDFESLKYLLQAIDDDRNDIFIHIDKRTSYADFDEIKSWVEKAGLFFVPRMKVRWGHSSFVKCELKLLEKATKAGHYHYYHFLSGVDFPLKSQDEIHDYLRDKDLEFINYHFDGDNGDEFAWKIRYYHYFMRWIGRGHFDGPGKQNAILRRIKDKNWELVGRQEAKGFDRRKKYQNIEFVKGDNWVSITDDFARFLLSKKNKIMRLSTFANTPDEFFIPTVAYNSVYKARIAGDNLRLIDWNRGNPYKFAYTDLDELKQSEKLFARKISFVNEPRLVLELMEHIGVKPAYQKPDNPQVSIVVPIYNVQDYLAKCLESISSQTYKNIQVIMVDDGSTDSSGNIAESFSQKDSRFLYIHQQNGGLSAARNTGIKAATGQYIAVVDSDDWVEPDYIEELLKVSMETDADITVCGLIKESSTPQEISIKDNKVYSRTSAMNILSNIFTEDYLVINVAWNKLYKKKLFDKVSYPTGKLHEDEYIIHRLIDESRLICTTPKALYHYRIRDDSITGAKQAANIKHFDIIEAHKDRVKFCKRQIYGGFYRLIVYSLFEEIIWLMPTYDHSSFKKYGLNNKFRRIMLREYIKNYSQLDRHQRFEYLSVIINPEEYKQNSDS